jgi:hypothetical protein
LFKKAMEAMKKKVMERKSTDTARVKKNTAMEKG